MSIDSDEAIANSRKFLEIKKNAFLKFYWSYVTCSAKIFFYFCHSKSVLCILVPYVFVFNHIEMK